MTSDDPSLSEVLKGGLMGAGGGAFAANVPSLASNYLQHGNPFMFKGSEYSEKDASLKVRHLFPAAGSIAGAGIGGLGGIGLMSLTNPDNAKAVGDALRRLGNIIG